MSVEHVIVPDRRDLGGFSVQRALPALARRTVGPFVFFDVMGPLAVVTGRELEVRPHPHIGLATLTWLFEGGLMHRDSLGSVQVIHPGAVNLMTAGRGIVHSERMSQAGLEPGARMHGAQFWLGLPKSEEECAPAFAHHPADTIPAFERDGATGRVVIGRFADRESPVRFPHPALCVDLRVAAGRSLALDTGYAEAAVYVVEGTVAVDGATHAADRLLVFGDGRIELVAEAAAHLLIVGGAPLDGPRHLRWNFVSSSVERLDRAERDWKAGRFDGVPGETEFIPFPGS